MSGSATVAWSSARNRNGKELKEFHNKLEHVEELDRLQNEKIDMPETNHLTVDCYDAPSPEISEPAGAVDWKTNL